MAGSASVINMLLKSKGTGIIALRPGSDSAQAHSLQNAAGTNVLTVDTSNSRVGVGSGNSTPSALLDVLGATTASASLRLRSGTAPTSPNDGDIWFDGTNLKIRIGGVTKTVTVT